MGEPPSVTVTEIDENTAPTPGSPLAILPDSRIDAHSAHAAASRITAIVEENADFVWRSLRRMGVPESHAEDAAQEVFIVALRKIDRMEPGRERAYLFGIAIHVAAHVRRSFARKKEVVTATTPVTEDAAPGPDVALDERRARAQLDAVLDAMEEDLRAVFILYELEGTTMIEIARLLDLPAGTVASRLRRARDVFHQAASRLRTRSAKPSGGVP